MGDPPSTWFSVHPSTCGPRNHSGGTWVNRISSTNHVGLPLGKIGAGQLVHAYSRSSPSKGGSGLQSPLILILGLYIDLAQLENEVTP